MKKIQLLFVLLLCLALLTGCVGTPTEPTETTTAPTETTTVPTEPTQPPWPGYVDHKTKYTYYYSEGRELEWEEDILYFANSMVQEHPMLRNRAFLIDLPNYETDSANFYDEAFFREFIEQINLLIPEVENLTDKEIIYRLQYILALFNDVHTRLEYYEGDYFPILFLPFQEYGKTAVYAVLLDERHEDALYSRLESINGYTVEQIMEMISPYCPMETEYGLVDALGGGGMGMEYLSRTEVLEAAGVIELDATEAVYILTGVDGKTHELTLKAGIESTEWVGQWYNWTYSVPYAYYDTQNFWFTEELYDNTLYIRISSFQETAELRYKDFSDGLSQAYRTHGTYGKVILDLRGNGGGSEGTGFDVMIKEMVKIQCDQFYILIDGGTYSQSTIFAGELVARRGDVQLVGTPAGEAAGFFAGIYNEDYIMPHCGLEFTIPTGYYQPFPAGEDNIIMPDWLIYPTLADYKAGIDTALYAILLS